MEWIDLAYVIFQFRWWALWVVLALYVVPLLRLLTFPLSLGHPFFMFFNRRFGQFEHAVAWFRDTAVVAYLFLFGLWQLSNAPLLAAGAFFLVGLSYWNRISKRNARQRLLDFVRKYPAIHPKEFFSHLLCSSGAFRHKLPKAPYHTVDTAHLNFKSENGLPFQNVVSGIWSTIWCTRLSMMALKWKGRDFLREVASAMSVIWGTRIAQLSKSEVIVEGAEKLRELHGYNIYLFNHGSFIDFGMASVLTGKLPRFLVARDHFLDNPVFRSVLGIGRVAEAFGMVFVERKGNESQARAVVEEAAIKLVREGIDFAIFPQGTRAIGKKAANGERLEAGYYTVGSRARMKREGDHLKKGAAHLGACTALVLAEEKIDADVNLVPVAIKGTSIVAPKGSKRIKPNVTIRLKVGEPIIIKPGEVAGIGDNQGQTYLDFVRRLHTRIDHELKSVAGVHVDLERRFFEDMRTMAESLDIEEMAIAMKPWRGDDYLVHAILDCIYACDADNWFPFLGRLMYLIKNDATREELLTFKGEVVDKMSG